MSKKRVVVAFSGGLDTSFCVKYLAEERGMEVYSAFVHTGGFTQEGLEQVAERARLLGVTHHTCLEQTNQFYQKCIKYLVFGNVLRYQTYPLSVSAERVFQAMAIATYAKEVGAQAIAHGSTGAGNDQIRFDMIFRIMAPEMAIITPIRDLKLSREEEIAYLQKAGVDMDWTKAAYSVNKGLWGTSVGGKETLTSSKPLPEEAYPTKVAVNEPREITLHFQNGELAGIDNTFGHDPVALIDQLEALAAPFGIGRDVHVGDTIIGIKGRVGFQAAAPLLIIKAHHLLEKHTLTKWQIYWKEQLANWYGMLVHEGQFLDPVLRNIESFLTDTQKVVTGKVFIKLHPYRFELQGIESAHDLMQSKFGSYGEMNNTWTGEDARGFAKILANQLMIFQQTNNQHGES